MTLPEDPGPLHPRPQLTRSGWTDLCGTWSFAFDDDDDGIRDRWYDRADPFLRTILVPFPPESPASGIADTGFHPVVWYRREFDHATTPHGRTLLHFGAVDYRASVWVNGRHVTSHEGGHTPFWADVTDVLVEDGSQVVVVRAEDLPGDLSQPRGKQDWQADPHAIWYHRTTGIWQPVWLEEVPATRLASLRWTPDVDQAAVGLVARVEGPPIPGLRLRVVLRLSGEVQSDDTYSVAAGTVRRQISVECSDMSLGRSAHLWSPESPHLIEVSLTLFTDDGVVDDVGSYFAMRSVAVSRERLLLNGRPYHLRLVLAQNYWPESHLAAPSAEALKREVELAKELGFNGVRLHQKIEDPRFLAWCDRLGLMVWAEMPSPREFSPVATGRVVREWLAVLDRDYSHPCVIAWVPVNESWGAPALERSAEQRALVRSLYHLTKSLDATRIVIGNDGWEQLDGDVFTIHDYTADAQVLRERYGSPEALEKTLAAVQPLHRLLVLPDARRHEQPVMVTEFGGISLDVGEPHGWRGYGGVRDAAALLSRFTEQVDALMDSTALVGFCWTQLTDTAQERNGLLTERRAHKIAPEQVRAVLRRASAAVPGDLVSEFANGDYQATPAPEAQDAT